MSGIALFRENLKGFYTQFGSIINVCLKFLLALTVFLAINRQIGYSTFFTNIFIVIIMALLCSILKLKALLFFAAVLIFGDCMSLGWDVAALAVILMLLLWIVFVVFVPDDSHAVIFAPLGIFIGVPALAPVAYGLKRNPATIAAIWPGIIMHYFILAIGQNSSAISQSSSGDYMTRIGLITGTMTSNSSLIFNLAASAVLLIIVYAIRNISTNRSWQAAVIVGGILYIVMAVLANAVLKWNVNLLLSLIGGAVSIVLGLVLLIFIHNVDYKMSEQLSFEDDDYYYYVKAIPKSGASYLKRREKNKEQDAPEEEGPQMEPDVWDTAGTVDQDVLNDGTRPIVTKDLKETGPQEPYEDPDEVPEPDKLM